MESSVPIASKESSVFGDADFVVSMTAFAREIGLIPVVCAAGGRSPRFESAIQDAVENLPANCVIRDGVDFSDIEQDVTAAAPDLLIGSSKGYAMSRRLNIPLMRAGFPVHDRVDGPRMLSVGYRGAQQLFDRICNTLMDHRQNESPVSFSYM
jgi:nitrogenase molybdenum-iron protein NifN